MSCKSLCNVLQCLGDETPLCDFAVQLLLRQFAGQYTNIQLVNTVHMKNLQSWKLICRLLKLFRNFAPSPPYNVELRPGNQRCEQHCAGGGGGGPIAFHRGCLHRIIVQRLYQIVRQYIL